MQPLHNLYKTTIGKRALSVRLPRKDKMRDVLRENRQFWEECFAKFDFDFQLPPRKRVLRVIRRLQKYQAYKVLDLGCGFGRWSIALAQAGFQVKAVDISSEAIKWLKKWGNQESLSIETKVSSAQKLASIGEKVDAVICNSVLDHIPFAEALKAMRNIKKILKPNGIAYISFDGLEKEDKREVVVLNDGTIRYIKGKRKGLLWRFYTNAEIKTLCQGMEILEFIEKRNRKREIWVRKKH